MSRPGWKARLRVEQRRLATLLPLLPDDTVPAVVSAIAALRAFAQCKPSLRLQPGCTQPTVELPAGWQRCRYVSELVDGLADTIASMLRGDHGMFDPAKWAIAFGFAELLTQQLPQAKDADPLGALAGEGAAAAGSVMDLMLAATRSHVGAVLARDLPWTRPPREIYRLSADQVWLLALPYEGQAERDAVLLRRRQALRSGDTLVVWKLDRLGSNLRHLVNLVGDLTARKVGLKVLAGEGASIDTTTVNGRLVFAIFAGLAEFERELIVERTKAGLPETKVGDLCEELGITRQTLYRFVSPTGDLRDDGKKLLDRRKSA